MDTVGDLEEDEPSSAGDSEEEETGPRVRQKVGGTVNFEANMGRESLLSPNNYRRCHLGSSDFGRMLSV